MPPATGGGVRTRGLASRRSMSWFVLHPPNGRPLVSFFITARWAGQSDRVAFTDVVIEQLAELLGEPMPAHYTDATRDQSFTRSTRPCCRGLPDTRGERLILLIDGLDEDRGSDARGIAALLPADAAGRNAHRRFWSAEPPDPHRRARWPSVARSPDCSSTEQVAAGGGEQDRHAAGVGQAAVGRSSRAGPARSSHGRRGRSQRQGPCQLDRLAGLAGRGPPRYRRRSLVHSTPEPLAARHGTRRVRALVTKNCRMPPLSALARRDCRATGSVYTSGPAPFGSNDGRPAPPNICCVAITGCCLPPAMYPG